MHRWLVGGALIRHDDGLVLVANRRRDRSLEWTPPGGIIDSEETLLAGLAREVHEETGLEIVRWAGCSYSVVVEAPDMGWHLRVEAWEAAEVVGDVHIADPDGIVEEVRHVTAGDAPALLQLSPPWVHVPVGEWLAGRTLTTPEFRFSLRGSDRATAAIERLA